MLSGGHRIATLGMLLIVGFTALSSQAQDIERFMISDADFRALPPEAQEHYLAGVDALDHIDYLMAHNEYRRAAELAPDSSAMQFRLVDLARRQAQTSTARRAEDYLVVAREALNRIIASSAANPDDQRRAEYMANEITQSLENSPRVEQERLESGRTFVHALALQKDWFDARTSDMTRAIMIHEGAGPAVVRSSVVLIDANGYLYRPDMTPVMRDGRQVSRENLEGATIEESPTQDFLQGVPQAAEETIEFDDFQDFFTTPENGGGEMNDGQQETSENSFF